MDEHYEYADQFPRNEEIILEAGVQFNESKEEKEEEEDKSDDEDCHKKGTETENTTTAYVFLAD